MLKIKNKINKKITTVGKVPPKNKCMSDIFANEIKVIYNGQPKNLSLSDFKATFNTYG